MEPAHAGPIVRVEEAALGPEAHVRLVVSRVSDLAGLRARWASSGATLEVVGERLRATTTVEALARAAGRSLPREEAEQLDAALRSAVASWGAPAPATTVAGGVLSTERGPLVMGIVNVTPDSFADGGTLYPDGHPDAAIRHGSELVAQGADLLDVGGESTRPGAEAVPEEEELRRVVPVVEALAADGATVSIDTTKPAVARAALAAGAQVVNDVSGGRDPELLAAAAEAGAGYVLMHARGTPQDMQRQTEYDDVVAEVYEFLADGLARCEEAGIKPSATLIDPGIGFAKLPEHNLVLLRALRQFRGLGRPVLVGASRKSFLGAVLDRSGTPAPVDERLEGSLACAALATEAGAAVLRVHDVAATVRVVATVRAITTPSLM